MVTVALVGRPNVGKSTLFNRLVGKKLALVDDRPGVTRDRREGIFTFSKRQIVVVDTAGYEDCHDESLLSRMREQTEVAVETADVCLFIVDARQGITPLDEIFATLLRRRARRVILVANKTEGTKGDSGLLEAYSLGFGEPLPISAAHGEGIQHLCQQVIELIPEVVHSLDAEENDASGEGIDFDVLEEEASSGQDISDKKRMVQRVYTPQKPLRVAVIGRPNAGKSTLINTLIGQERLLTGPEAGITRDSIGIEWEWKGIPVKIFDTAGMRRRSKVQEKLEKLSVADTLRAVQFAEVVVILMDALISFEKQDLHIVELIEREGRAVVVVLNKWDLVDENETSFTKVREHLDKMLPQIKGAPLVTTSGLSGRGLEKMMDAVMEAAEVWNKRVGTGSLNRWLNGVTQMHPPPAVSGRRMRLRYMTQIKSRPPSFVVFTSRPDKLPESYMRYLVGSLRETFDIPGVPMRLMLRKVKNPYVDED